MFSLSLLLAFLSPTVPLDAVELPPPCVTHRSEAIYSVGYTHVVTLTNRCQKPARCVVSTDVSPTPIQVQVPAESEVSVTTFRGSPARVFTAKVECKLD